MMAELPYALSLPERQTRLNRGFMSKEHCKLTVKQREVLQALQALPDDKIDYSEIPANEPSQWHGAKVGEFFRPIKQQLTLRIDSDVVAWFKGQGKGYQTRINELLRQAMAKETNH
jgi:uncharacterized protein (DUF4415 family)